MTTTTHDLKHEVEKSLELMQTLSGEIRVKLHLAGMEAKDEWRKVEPALNEVERAATDFGTATSKALSAIATSLSSLQSKSK